MQVKEIKTTMAYRIEQIVFAQDGGTHATIQVGTITKQDAGTNFEPIASQSHYLSAEEMAQIIVPGITDDESVKLRDLIEYCIENKLREKGALKY